MNRFVLNSFRYLLRCRCRILSQGPEHDGRESRVTVNIQDPHCSAIGAQGANAICVGLGDCGAVGEDDQHLNSLHWWEGEREPGMADASQQSYGITFDGAGTGLL